MQVYNEMNWVGFAIDQAMMMCDKLLIMEGSQFVAFSDIPERSDDGTLDIINDKVRQYPEIIKIINTTRKHSNYRLNQCANFNFGLDHCKTGDYFLQLDADEFFLDEWITEANELMGKRKVDHIKALVYHFAFSFKWRVDFGGMQSKSIIVKKTEELRITPTHKLINTGNNIITIPRIGNYHYCWLKPRERMRARMRTSGMYPDMLNWFDKNWDNFKLENGKEYPCYIGKFTLYKYEDKHPLILDSHPWRDIEDIRRL